MRLEYSCSACKNVFKATEQYFYPCYLKKAQQKPALTSLPTCKDCSRVTTKEYRQKLRDKGVSRTQKTLNKELWNKKGIVYIIGSDVPNTPFKIGMVSGTDVKKRVSALQTSHWIELKEVWKSSLLPHALSVEKRLHTHFEHKKVRGEWFNLNSEDIKSIPQLLEKFEEQNAYLSNP